MMPLKLTQRENAILAITVALGIFSAIYFFLISPLIGKNSFLDKEINGSRLKLNAHLRVLSRKNNINNRFSKLNSGTDLANNNEKERSTSTFSAIETLAKDAKIAIIDIRPQALRDRGLYKETLIDIKTEGEIEGYFKFIYTLENSLLLRIKKFQLNSKPGAVSLEGSFSVAQLYITD